MRCRRLSPAPRRRVPRWRIACCWRHCCTCGWWRWWARRRAAARPAAICPGGRSRSVWAAAARPTAQGAATMCCLAPVWPVVLPSRASAARCVRLSPCRCLSRAPLTSARAVRNPHRPCCTACQHRPCSASTQHRHRRRLPCWPSRARAAGRQTTRCGRLRRHRRCQNRYRNPCLRPRRRPPRRGCRRWTAPKHRCSTARPSAARHRTADAASQARLA
jgi:hypothetical protein